MKNGDAPTWRGFGAARNDHAGCMNESVKLASPLLNSTSCADALSILCEFFPEGYKDVPIGWFASSVECGARTPNCLLGMVNRIADFYAQSATIPVELVLASRRLLLILYGPEGLRIASEFLEGIRQ